MYPSWEKKEKKTLKTSDSGTEIIQSLIKYMHTECK